MSSTRRPLRPAEKLALGVAVWLRFLVVRLVLPHTSLPAFVDRLSEPRRIRKRHQSPARLSRAVHRSLRLGDRRPTCIVSALVLFRLLREQGDHAVLVIGLPEQGHDQTAHAWVEIEGRDVGPPPGRGDHVPLARFGS